MTIADSLRAGKAQLGRLTGLTARVPRDVLVVAIVVLASSASFGLGYLTGQGGQGSSGLQVSEAAELPAAAAAAVDERITSEAATPAKASAPTPTPPAAAAGGQYVASKTGSKFYLPWCGGVKAIKDANKVWFATKADALAAGYTPAANCKGI